MVSGKEQSADSGIKSTLDPAADVGCVENDWLLFHIWKGYIVHIRKDGQTDRGR